MLELRVPKLLLRLPRLLLLLVIDCIALIG